MPKHMWGTVAKSLPVGELIPEEEEAADVPEEGEVDVELISPNEKSIIQRGDNLPKVDLSKYHNEGKERHHIQVNNALGKVSTNKKISNNWFNSIF